MLKIGLTGGIGSGKSTVAKVFETLGIPVYYADTAAKILMNEDPFLKEKITRLFGADAYLNGQLNRTHIAGIAFNDPAKLELLNSWVHPATIQAAEVWMLQQNSPYAIKEAALIFESGAQEHLDFVIGVKAPLALRIQRTIERDGISKEEVIKRMNRQLEESIKMKLCDFIITNDEQQLLVPQVLALHEVLLKK
ncbi:MAG: dephospho-CoA kinase [Chitinophagaceae bacterium]